MPKVEIPADQVFPVLKENILVDGFHVVIDLERSHGAVIVDALEGKDYLDCYGCFATLPAGHNHPKLRDEGFRESLMTAALANPSNSDMYSREFASFVKTFRALAVPAEVRYLFFVAGGGLAVENAMKAAFDWKAQRTGRVASNAERTRFSISGTPFMDEPVIHFRSRIRIRPRRMISRSSIGLGFTAPTSTSRWTRRSSRPRRKWLVPKSKLPSSMIRTASPPSSSSPFRQRVATITFGPSSLPSSGNMRTGTRRY